MDKSIHKISNIHYSPRINSWAIMKEMDKSIHKISNIHYSPRINSWAMKMRGITQNRFAGFINNK